MDFRLSKVLAATGLALLMATAGCSGTDGPDDTPDGGLCEDKTCPVGTGCNPENGNCMNLCSLPSAPACQAPLACKPDTGKCENLCADVTCSSDTLACNPASGVCEPKCKPGLCASGYSCVPTTGECIKTCETNTKPNGKPECGAGFKCSQSTGECIGLCEDVSCRADQWCEPDVAGAKGVCKSGRPPAGYPGAACGSDTDCDSSLLVGNASFECAEDLNLGGESLVFPGGYCLASCQGQCPQGSVCTGIGCLDLCIKDADCRDDYRCSEIGLDQPVCFPASSCEAEDPADCSPIGGDCVGQGDCVGGAECFAERVEQRTSQGVGTGVYEFSGFEGGMCLYFTVNQGDCPSGTEPASIGDGRFICLPSCEIGDVDACGFGEACQPVSQSAAGCFIAECAADSDCAFAECSATNTERCGKGQACESGFCSTRDKCSSNSDCSNGLTCDDGLCTGTFCDSAMGLCLFDRDCTSVDAGTINDFSEIGLVCNEGTGRFERPCNNDSNCGANAYCSEDSLCVARCSLNNEASVCGDDKVCHPASGRCEDKCSSNDDCSNGELCNAGGHCVARCDAPVGATTCWPNQACGVDGLCGPQCTKANEVTVCGSNAFCDVPTKTCKPNTCTYKPSLCTNDQVCSNDACVARCDLDVGATDCGGQLCNAEGLCVGCTTNDECGGELCSTATGVCEACQDDAECGAGSICESSGKCVAGCDESTDCGSQVCNEDSGRCEACNGDAQCPGTSVCEVGECVAACDVGGCGDQVCNTASGRCEACSGELACGGGLVCADDKCIEACTSESCEDGVCNTETGLCEAETP